jgi:DNA-directed RNA polymerase subunit N
LSETPDAKNPKSSEDPAHAQKSRKATGKEKKAMIIPVRCFTCGKLVGDRWEEFARRIKTGENASDVLDSLGIKRYCCRRMLLSNVEIIDEVLRFYEEAEKRKEARNLY